MDYVITLPNMIILFALVFFAGVVDSVAGGGGIITVPAFMFVGLPAHYAIGSNKVTVSFGTFLATMRFWKNKSIEIKIALISAIASFISGYIGSTVALHISDDVLKKIILFTLPVVAVVILTKREFGDENSSAGIEKKKAYILAFIIGIMIGFYDGLIGPGTGTFAIIAYCIIMKYDLKTASGNAKVLNSASCISSAIRYVISGKVVYAVAIPAVIFSLLGNYIGSGLAIKKGASFIKPMMIVVIVLLFSKILFQDILQIIL